MKEEVREFQTILFLTVTNVENHVTLMLTVLMKRVIYYLFSVKNADKE